MAAAVSGDAGALYRLVAGLLDDGIPIEDVLFDGLSAIEREVGSRWAQGDVLIAEEHAATATVETVVSLLAGSLDQPDTGPRLLIAAAEGDHHSLPGRLTAAYLLYIGYRTTYLGGNIQAEDLSEYLSSDQPEAMILSCALTTHLPGARAAIKVSHEAGVPVIVGGKGFGPDGKWAAPLGADAWVATPRDLPTTLEEWSPDPKRAELSALNPPSGLRDLADGRVGNLASAQSHYAAGTGTPPDWRATSELDHLYSAVISALLVDDPALLAAELDWQQRTLGAQRSVDSKAIASALHTALGTSGAAAEMMARALEITDSS